MIYESAFLGVGEEGVCVQKMANGCFPGVDEVDVMGRGEPFEERVSGLAQCGVHVLDRDASLIVFRFTLDTDPSHLLPRLDALIFDKILCRFVAGDDPDCHALAVIMGGGGKDHVFFDVARRVNGREIPPGGPFSFAFGGEEGKELVERAGEVKGMGMPHAARGKCRHRVILGVVHCHELHEFYEFFFVEFV